METGVVTGRKLERMLLHRMGKAVADYGLIKAGDRVAVALSGGKDSFSLVDLLVTLQRKAPVPFDLVALTIHNGSSLFQSDLIGAYLEERGIPFVLERTDITAIVEEKRRPGTPYCSLCARLRRGALYGAALSLGCNKLALGHHLDDAAETLLMNLFFQGSLKAMPPKLLAENGKICVIRPLAYVPESMIIDYAEEKAFPVIDCGCWLCGEKEQERTRMKRIIADLSARHPRVRRSILSAMTHVEPRFLMDPEAHDFEGEEAPHDPPG